MRLTKPLSQAQFDNFLKELIFRGFKWDVQVGDHCSISRRGIILAQPSAATLYSMAEALWIELRKIEEWVCANPEALAQLGLPRQLSRLLDLRQSAIPRMARFDFHFTQEGWKISEVNSDVPGGYIETAMLPLLWPDVPGRCKTSGNPAAIYIAKLLPYLKTGAVGLLHASWFSEDRQHMEFLKSILNAHGIEATAIGTEEITFSGGKTFIHHNRQLEMLIRFLPCEWLTRSANAAHWFSPSACMISNPLFSIVSQTKRLPLIWDELPFDVPLWKQLLPDTGAVSLRDFIYSDRVLKPCLGRVGENIYLPSVNAAKRSQLLRQIAFNSKFWISQEMFYTVNIGSSDEDAFPCLGVYVIDGKAEGIYGRISRTRLTDATAIDAPVFIEEN